MHHLKVFLEHIGKKLTLKEGSTLNKLCLEFTWDFTVQRWIFLYHIFTITVEQVQRRTVTIRGRDYGLQGEAIQESIMALDLRCVFAHNDSQSHILKGLAETPHHFEWNVAWPWPHLVWYFLIQGFCLTGFGETVALSQSESRIEILLT